MLLSSGMSLNSAKITSLRRDLRWTESIAQKMKRKKKVEDIHVKKEIVRSVFDPPSDSTTISGGVVSLS
jgi:hypothetical protein